MPKFCPNCGNKMSDNAKFCIECGAKLGDYTSGAGIKDSVIQRSQVGMASVGKVEISPTINAGGGYVCRICGSAASAKCGHCDTYICGKHLKKVFPIKAYSVKESTRKTIGQIISAAPIFFCKECFEANRIAKGEVENLFEDDEDGTTVSIRHTGLWNIYGYFTEDELRNIICKKCGSYVAFFQCKKCGMILCMGCLAYKDSYHPQIGDLNPHSFSTYGCPQCNPEWKK